MGDEKWSAAIRPELHPAAQELVAAYKSVQGGETYPCLPEGIAAVLDHVRAKDDLWVFNLADLAALLRGEPP
jgi:hypothetical protein